MSAATDGTGVIELAARALEIARRVAGPAADVEVSVHRDALALTRFANSFIHQNVADTTTSVRLRVHRDGRTATGNASGGSTDALQGLVERTLAAAALLPPDRRWPGLCPSGALHGAGNVDEATVAAAPTERAAMVRAFVDAAGGLETAGYCRSVSRDAAYANSAGHAVAGRASSAAFDGIARTGGADGVARDTAVRLSDLDGHRLGQVAAAKARAAVDPRDLPPGRYQVVLEPGAMADVLQLLAWYGFNGKAVTEHTSFVEVGAPQFDAAVDLFDDPVHEDAIGVPFDDDGTPKQRLALVDAGVTAGVTYDRRTATDSGATSTGHADAYSATIGPRAEHLRLQPAAARGAAATADGPYADSSVAELVAGVTHGLLVSDFWYTRVLDPRTLVITGLTRNGVWLIEGGQVTRPVTNLRFTQSYADALAPGAVVSVGTHIARVPDRWALASTDTPALHLASWNFTGGASG